MTIPLSNFLTRSTCLACSGWLQVAVHDADPPGLRHRDRQRAPSVTVSIADDMIGMLSAIVFVTWVATPTSLGKNLGGLRHKQHIIERQTDIR